MMNSLFQNMVRVGLFLFVVACSGGTGTTTTPAQAGGGQQGGGGTTPATPTNLSVDVAGCGDPVAGGSAWTGVAVTTANLANQWQLQNGLIPTPAGDPCRPPNGFFCDPETVTLTTRQGSTTDLNFLAVFPGVSIQDIDQWSLVLTGGTDQQATRPASIRQSAGNPAPMEVSTVSLAGSMANGAFVDGCLIFTRTDNNSTSYYRPQRGSPGSF